MIRLLLPLCLVLVAAACAPRPASAWQPEHATAAAWWIEDVAHGLPRLAGELDLDGDGDGLHRVAQWAGGSIIEGRWEPPRRLLARRTRWAAIAAAIGEQEIDTDGSGLLRVAAAAVPVRRAALAALVDAENDDRRFIDGLVLTLGSPDPEVERIFLAAVRSARCMLDAPSAAHQGAAGQAAH